MDVHQHCTDETEAQDPEQHRARHDGHEELTQELGVVVVLGGTEVHLQVAHHVHQHEPEQHDARDRHGVLLADGGAVEVEQK